MQKINKKQKIIIFASILLVVVIATVFVTSAITKNIINNVGLNNNDYLASIEDTKSGMLASYIKKGVTLGEITGTLEDLDTSDATANPEDITKGKTAYVKGKKITGTREEQENIIEINEEEWNISYADKQINGYYLIKQNCNIKDNGDGIISSTGDIIIKIDDDVECKIYSGSYIGNIELGENSILNIYDGKFNGEFINATNLVIYGGTFSSDVSMYLGPGCMLEYRDGLYVVIRG